MIQILMNKNLALILSGQFVSKIGDKFYMLTYGFLLKLVSCSWLMATTGVFLMLLSGLFYRSCGHIVVPDKEHLVIDPKFHD